MLRVKRVIWLGLSFALLLVACEDDEADRPPSTATAASVTATAPAGPPATFVGLTPPERDRVRAALGQRADTGIEVSAQPLPGVPPRVVRSWAAVVHQRHDVFELRLEDVRRALRGEVTDWSQLGGSPRPLAITLPSDDADEIQRLFGTVGVGPIRRAPGAEVLDLVASQPGMLGLVPVELLRPGVLALVVEGHDPYRDPAAVSPLRAERWIRAPDSATAEEVARALGANPVTAQMNPAGVLATGDYIPARCSWAAMQRNGVLATLSGVAPLMRKADLAVVASDASLLASSPPTPCVRTFTLQGPAAAIEPLTDAGVDVLTRASNHALDCWSACGYATVIREMGDLLRAAGIAHTGVGASLAEARTPVLIERDGVRFAVLAYDDIAPYYQADASSLGTAPLDLAMVAADVRAAKARADHVLVAISAGVEYVADPTDRQREAARVAAQAGASLVIGNHPHWVQATERIGEAFVVYALGNFVFDQDWSVPTEQGMLLEVGFTKERMLGYRLRPHQIREEYRPELLSPASPEGASIMRRVWDATDRLAGR